jgi:hypothetical protein
MGTWIMTLTTRRQLTDKDASVELKAFAFSREGAEKKLRRKAVSVYGENFAVTGLTRKGHAQAL